MTTTNSITGDLIKTKTGNKDSQKAYEDGWERIFGNKNQERESENQEKDIEK